jgi:hypothetical protein
MHVGGTFTELQPRSEKKILHVVSQHILLQLPVKNFSRWGYFSPRDQGSSEECAVGLKILYVSSYTPVRFAYQGSDAEFASHAVPYAVDEMLLCHSNFTGFQLSVRLISFAEEKLAFIST